jgi:hypothetical protein
MTFRKITTLLPFYYQNYYPKIAYFPISVIKVVKVVIRIYTHERKRDNYSSIGGISKKNYYLNTPPPRKPKIGQKKVVMKNYYLKFSEFFSCPHRKIGQKKVVKCLTVIYLNLKRG